MNDSSSSKKINPSFSMDFESWMNILEQKSLSQKDQDLFTQGLQEHPEWLNQSNSFQQTLLMKASSYGHLPIVNLLIELGADLNLQDQDGWTALIHAAVEEDCRAVCKVLIQSGADLNVQSQAGWTALMRASLYEKDEMVQLLIQSGADLNLQNKLGATALIRSSRQGSLDIVKKMTHAKADLNLQDHEGWTALMKASYYGHVELVKELIQQGADLMIMNKRHQTALNLAKENDRDAIVCYLEAHLYQQILRQEITSSEQPVTSRSDTTLPTSSKIFRL